MQCRAAYRPCHDAETSCLLRIQDGLAPSRQSGYVPRCLHARGVMCAGSGRRGGEGGEERRERQPLDALWQVERRRKVGFVGVGGLIRRPAVRCGGTAQSRAKQTFQRAPVCRVPGLEEGRMAGGRSIQSAGRWRCVDELGCMRGAAHGQTIGQLINRSEWGEV